MRVIDASSLAKYVNREPNWRVIENYLIEGCITLSLAVKEVINSVWKRLHRGELDRDKAYRVVEGFIENLMVRLVDQDDLYIDAFKISVEHGVTIYDSLYIALAAKHSIELLTSDEKQSEVAGLIGVRVIYIP